LNGWYAVHDELQNAPSTCDTFHELKLIKIAIFCDFSEKRARYSEKVEIPEIGLMLQAHYGMEPAGEGSTRLNFNVNWMDANLPADKKQGMMAGQTANFELFKKVCETNPAQQAALTCASAHREKQSIRVRRARHRRSK